MSTGTAAHCGTTVAVVPDIQIHRHKPEKPMMDGTLVRLEQQEHSVTIHTYCRKHGKSRRFYIHKARLVDWLDSSSGYSFIDRDGADYLQAYNAGEEIRIEISWLSASCSGSIEGYGQSFTLPKSLLAETLQCEGEHTYLWTGIGKPRELNFSSALTATRYMAENKLRRRAFCKAIATTFSWRGTKRIDFYSDFPGGSFRFFEYLDGDGPGMNGGFILHSSTTATPAGDKERLYYSVHT